MDLNDYLDDPGVIWMFVGIAIGAFIASVFAVPKGTKLSKIRYDTRLELPMDDQNLDTSSEDEDEDEQSDEDEDAAVMRGLGAMLTKKKQGAIKIPDEELFQKFPIYQIKQVLVVRDDLKMGKGKIGA